MQQLRRLVGARVRVEKPPCPCVRQELQKAGDLGAGAAIGLHGQGEEANIRCAVTVVINLLIGLFPGHISPPLACVRVPGADGVRDNSGLLGNDEPGISRHTNALIAECVVGVCPAMSRAAAEEVVGQPGVRDLSLVCAVAVAWGWEREAEAEGEGDGKVRWSEAERGEDGDGMDPIPCPVACKGEQTLGVAGAGVQLHPAGRCHLVRISSGVDF
ncbi:hypothetical protein CLOM_g23967 [Closterium sp. NIES-68]|nr:hypothetical protein CLOM_g23967 [Closterium sp. NIES-68]